MYLNMADIECPNCGFNQDDPDAPAFEGVTKDEVECPDCGEVNHVDDL